MGRKRLASRRGFPANLYMNPTGYFYFINPNTKVKHGIGSDKTKAFFEARQANAALAGLKPSSLVDRVMGTTEITLVEWIPEYKKFWIEKDPPAASTLRNHTKYLDRIATASFAWMPIRSITTAHASQFLDDVLKESGSGTVVNVRSRMQDVFRMAATKGMIDAGKNPVSETYKPKREVLRERLSLEQFLAIRAAAQPWLANAMNLALVTGQRRDDLAKMQFAAYKDGKLEVIQGKGRGTMRIRIAGTLRLAALDMSLDEVIKQCRGRVVSTFMIHISEARGVAKLGACVTPNGISNAFQTARESAGIVVTDGKTAPSFHEIRSLSERLYRVERDEGFAQKLLGHTSPTMTSMYDNLRGSGWVEIG